MSGFLASELPAVRSRNDVTVSCVDYITYTCFNPNMINIDDFAKVEIRVGKILEAERLENSEKLLKLKVDFGEAGERQVLSGIAKFYSPEDLLGTLRVFITNLEPRQMMGLSSEAMILAAGNEVTLATLIPDKDVEAGTSIK